MADYKVGELVRDIDCHKVIAKYSRLYCDVEWFQNDADEPADGEAGYGRGLYAFAGRYAVSPVNA